MPKNNEVSNLSVDELYFQIPRLASRLQLNLGIRGDQRIVLQDKGRILPYTERYFRKSDESDNALNQDIRDMELLCAQLARLCELPTSEKYKVHLIQCLGLCLAQTENLKGVQARRLDANS